MCTAKCKREWKRQTQGKIRVSNISGNANAKSFLFNLYSNISSLAVLLDLTAGWRHYYKTQQCCKSKYHQWKGASLDVQSSPSSLMYKRNKRGPRTVSWDTPDRSGASGDLHQSTTTDWLRHVSHCVSQLLRTLAIVAHIYWFRRRWCATESKAFKKVHEVSLLTFVKGSSYFFYCRI